jgi:hypothetical protein
MDLVRFALLRTQIEWEDEDWRSFGLQSETVEVSSLTSWKSAQERIEVLIGGRVELDEPPEIDALGFVQVPPAPRKTAEAAIEAAANYISVFNGSSCEIFSPRLPVAFHSEDRRELDPLRGSKGVNDAKSFVAGDLFTTKIEPDLISELSDRDDGVALLAGALATTDLASTYREILRVFERAFAASSSKLASRLASFLKRRPALEYTKSEVKKWILDMRGPSVHADREGDLLVAADYRPVVHRMLFASYDVLLNKQIWHDPDPGRREIWAPTHGPGAGGGIVAIQGKGGHFAMEMLDCFSAFKMQANSPNFRLEADFWPRTGPESMAGMPQQMQVVGATEFGPTRPRQGDRMSADLASR